MATAVCIKIPTLPTPPSVVLPGIGYLTYLRDSLTEFPRASTYILRFLNSLSVALGPIFTLIKILDLVVALVNCVKAVKDCIITLSPGPIISCFEKLFKALAALIALLPPFAYIRLVRDIVSLVRSFIDDLLNVITLIDVEISRIKGTINKAMEENDPILLEIGNCAREDMIAQTQGIMAILEAMGKIISILLTVLDILAALVPGLDKQVKKMTACMEAFQQTNVPSAGQWPGLQQIVDSLMGLRNGLVAIEMFLSNVVGLQTNLAFVTPPTLANP